MVFLLATGLVACGDKESDGSADSTPSTHEPVKASEIADIVGDYVDQEPRVVKETEREEMAGEELEHGEIEDGVAAQMNLGDVQTGDFLAVAVYDPSEDADQDFSCESDHDGDGCATIDDGGDTVVLTWQEVDPEEDPGMVSVLLKRGREYVVVIYGGDKITGDPREQELSIPVDTMLDIVRDERLTLG